MPRGSCPRALGRRRNRWPVGLLICVAWVFPPDPASAQSSDSEAGRRATMQRMIEEVKEDYPDVPTISAAALLESLGSGSFVLVDVRTSKERSVSILPGAISADDFESRLQELAGRAVVAYCTIGVRSSDYARKMRKQGVDVLNLEGSVLAWTHIGGQFVSGGLPTDSLHVYGRRWNLAADGYKTIW